MSPGDKFYVVDSRDLFHKCVGTCLVVLTPGICVLEFERDKVSARQAALLTNISAQYGGAPHSGVAMFISSLVPFPIRCQLSGKEIGPDDLFQFEGAYYDKTQLEAIL